MASVVRLRVTSAPDNSTPDAAARARLSIAEFLRSYKTRMDTGIKGLNNLG